MDVTYAYDHNGMRIRKSAGQHITNYTLRGDKIVYLTWGINPNDKMRFEYDGQGRPAIVNFNGADYHYLYNLQGDVVGLIDNTGTLVVEYNYDAWGRIIGRTGSLASTLGYLNPFRYRGYVYDEETGLYYLRSRYYNPEWGRFINADGQFKLDGAVLTLNIFAYCINNPVKLFDENGKEYRVVGAGLQVDVSAAVGSLGVGVGAEVIVYWDETITDGEEPIIAIYVYKDGNIGMSLTDYQMAEILKSVQPTIEQLTAMTDDLRGLDVKGIDKVMQSASWGVTVAGLVITGNKAFDSVTSYEEDFDTVTLSLSRLKGSHSVSASCKSYGVGGTIVGSPQGWGVTYSHSYYKLIWQKSIG